MNLLSDVQRALIDGEGKRTQRGKLIATATLGDESRNVSDLVDEIIYIQYLLFCKIIILVLCF